MLPAILGTEVLEDYSNQESASPGTYGINSWASPSTNIDKESYFTTDDLIENDKLTPKESPQSLFTNASVAISEDSQISSDDGDISDDLSSSEADAPGSDCKRSVIKRVTWFGLDKLGYIPTRTMSRSRVRRKKWKALGCAQASKPSLSAPDKKSSKFNRYENSTDKAEKKVLTEETVVCKGEKVVIVRMRTGCLYMYKGPNARVVFKRS